MTMTPEYIAKRLEDFRAGVRKSREVWEKLTSDLDLSHNRRGLNLKLLRDHFGVKQETFCELLNVTQSKLSNFERNDPVLSEYEARRYEKEFGLPSGWLDRDNSAFLFLSNEEILLISELRTCSVSE